MNMTKDDDLTEESIIDIAKKIILAAKTAPKGKGENNMILSLITGETIKKISTHLYQLGEKYDVGAFRRDSQNILSAPALILFGTKIKPLGLKKCGMCGFKNCEEKNKHANIPCVFNTGDLGIAIGSAVSIAMDHRIDNRVMYTVGQAVLDMNLLGDEVKIVYALPLSASSKNPFFDRK